MRARATLIVVLIAVLASGLVGCEQIKNALKPEPTIKHVTIAAKVAAPDAPIGGKLKYKVPANLPLWPDSGLAKENRTKGANGDSWSATFVSHDPYDDIVNGTAKGFQDASWQVMQQDVSSPDTTVTVLTVNSSDGEGVVTITAGKGDTTRIGYVITTSK